LEKIRFPFESPFKTSAVGFQTNHSKIMKEIVAKTNTQKLPADQTGQPESHSDLPRRAFTVKEVADMYNVSEKTVYRLVKSGKLTACKIIRSLRITQKSLLECFGH
jgi:excisionase family DNA binding protein